MNEILLETLNVENLKRMLTVVLILWSLMIVAVLVDLWSGIEKAKARKEYVNSGGFRRTFAKVGEYWRVLAMLLLVDIIGNIFPWYSFPFASVLGTVAVIAIEFRSVIENLRDKHSASTRPTRTNRRPTRSNIRKKKPFKTAPAANLKRRWSPNR